MDSEKNEEILSYQELLQKPEWKSKRLSILIRDHNTCTICKQSPLSIITDANGLPTLLKSPINLQVHHKYYQEDLNPWEYPDDALSTLCYSCHKEFHLKNTVAFYQRINGKLVPVNLTPCDRCNGVGHIPQFAHVEQGICFRCRGAKYDEFMKRFPFKKID
jgi:hypothetical protein